MSPLLYIFEIVFLFYTAGDDMHAQASCSFDPATGEECTLTIIHEAASAAMTHDIVGRGISSRLELQSGESLILLVRREGTIVAADIYEVECAAADFGYILLHRGGFNLLVEQSAVNRLSALGQSVEVPV